MGGSCVSNPKAYYMQQQHQQQKQTNDDCCGCSAPGYNDYDPREIEGDFPNSPSKHNGTIRGTSPSRHRKEIFTGTYLDSRPRMREDGMGPLYTMSPSKQRRSFKDTEGFGVHRKMETVKVKQNFQAELVPTFANVDESAASLDDSRNNRIIEEEEPVRFHESGEISQEPPQQPRHIVEGLVNGLRKKDDQGYHTVMHYSQPKEKSSGLTESPHPVAERKRSVIDLNEPTHPSRVENKSPCDSTQPFASSLDTRKSDRLSVDFPAQTYLINYTNPFGHEYLVATDEPLESHRSLSRRNSKPTLQILNFQKPKSMVENSEAHAFSMPQEHLTPEKSSIPRENSPRERGRNFSRSQPFYPLLDEKYSRMVLVNNVPYLSSIGRDIEDRINNSLNQSQDFHFTPSPHKKFKDQLPPEKYESNVNEEPEPRSYEKHPLQQSQKRSAPILEVPLDRIKPTHQHQQQGPIRENQAPTQEKQSPLDRDISSLLRNPNFEKYRAQNFEGVPIFRVKTRVPNQQERRKSAKAVRKPNIGAEYFEENIPALMLTQAHCLQCEEPVERARFYPTHSFFGHPIFESPDSACDIFLTTDGNPSFRQNDTFSKPGRQGRAVDVTPFDIPMSDATNRREVAEGPKNVRESNRMPEGKENPAQQPQNRGRSYQIIQGPNEEPQFLVINQEKKPDRPIETYVEKVRKKSTQINDPFLREMAKTFVVEEDKNRRKSKALQKLEQSVRSLNSIQGTDEGMITSSRLNEKDPSPAERKTGDFAVIGSSEQGKTLGTSSSYQTPQLKSLKSEVATDNTPESTKKPVIRQPSGQFEKKRGNSIAHIEKEKTPGKDVVGERLRGFSQKLEDLQAKSQQRLAALNDISPENKKPTQSAEKNSATTTDTGSFPGKYSQMKTLEPKKSEAIRIQDESRRPGEIAQGVNGSKGRRESGVVASGSEEGHVPVYSIESEIPIIPRRRSSGVQAVASVRRSLPAFEMSQPERQIGGSVNSLGSGVYQSLGDV